VSPDGYRIAVLGATGAVGSAVLEILAQRDSIPARGRRAGQ
jgi:aspartate-semialdehyde dehydrogenase